MPDKHQFFSQPRGNPAWCFCRRPPCTGWDAYVTWYQAVSHSADEPDDDAVETARKITSTLAELTGYYGDLFGIRVDPDTALYFADIDMAARQADRVAPPRARRDHGSASTSRSPGPEGLIEDLRPGSRNP